MKTENEMTGFFVGCHLSSSGGFSAMAKTAHEINANTFQFFTRNPRGGKAKDISDEDVAEFLKLSEEYSLGKIIAHSPYTLNPCSADGKIREFARTTFSDDLQRMEKVPGNYYNFHPGSHVGQGVDLGIKLICDLLNEVLFPAQKTTVLLETMAGKGSEIGSRFEELRRIIDGTEHSELLGVCLDTCHVYDGGFDIVNDLDGVLEEFDRTVGIDRLKAIHLNDSKFGFACHKDRHEKIGEGHIGTEAFARIINHPALKDRVFCLETPNELDGYAKEIALLRSLRRD